MTLDDIRRFAVSRSLFVPTTLERAIDTLGFVQADPIRAPARAQDLTLRPRVDGYRAGDLERLYPALPVEEDVFINYGFVTRSLQALMHPRSVASLRPTARNRRAQAVLAFVRERGAAHPREVDAHFAHGTVKNYWGGASNATTHLLEAMHYKGWLRVARREGGVRIYAVHEHGPAPTNSAARQARIDAIVDLLVRKYGPLPAASLSNVVSRLRYAVPQWRGELARALQRATQRLSHARIERPPGTGPSMSPCRPTHRRTLCACWHRSIRSCGIGAASNCSGAGRIASRPTRPSRGASSGYALPLLWRDRVVGWGNVSVNGGKVQAVFGYVDSRPPRNRAFERELEAEVERMRVFLVAASSATVPVAC